MNKLLLLSLLKQGGYFMLNKILIKKLGLVETAIMSLLLDKNARHGDDFFVTAETARDALNIGRRPYDGAIATLKEKGLIRTYLKESPPKTYFIINYDLLASYLQDVQIGQLNLYGEDELSCAERTTSNNKDNNPSSLLLNNNSCSQLDSISDPVFEEFWTRFDKKVQRAQAERAWKKLKKADIDAIMSRVDAYVKSTPDRQYRMNPATYLNPSNRRWEDEIRPIQQQATTGPVMTSY